MNKFEDYEAFLKKFETKKTTDDCYTPAKVMEVVYRYVEEATGISQDNYVRPFYPGGDYEQFEYPEGCVVVDNPPFSILSKITSFYQERNIKFFLFAPTLTINSTIKDKGISCIVIKKAIQYTNKANVATCFITNIPKRPYIVYSEKLENKISELFPTRHKEALIRTIPNFVNAALIATDKVKTPIYLDNYKYITHYNGRKIFGGGFIKED